MAEVENTFIYTAMSSSQWDFCCFTHLYFFQIYTNTLRVAFGGYLYKMYVNWLFLQSIKCKCVNETIMQHMHYDLEPTVVVTIKMQ